MNLRYSPEVTLGHIIQAVTLIAMIGGGAITSYVSLRTDIASASERSARAIAETNARVLAIEVRRTSDESFQNQTRQDLRDLLNSVNEVKVQLVGKADRSISGRSGAGRP